MKKKFVCQLLALSMTAVMAVPQAGLPVFAASAANTQQAQLKEEAKVGTEITQLEGSTSWMTGTLEKSCFLRLLPILLTARRLRASASTV